MAGVACNAHVAAQGHVAVVDDTTATMISGVVAGDGTGAAQVECSTRCQVDAASVQRCVLADGHVVQRSSAAIQVDSTAVVALRFVSGEGAVADGEVAGRPDGAAACSRGVVAEGATADVRSTVVDDGTATSVAEATCNGAASNGQRATGSVIDATAVIASASGNHAAAHGHGACVENGTALMVNTAARDSSALEVEYTAVVDTSTVRGEAASNLSAVVATAVLDGQRAAIRDTDDVAVARNRRDVTLQHVAIEVNGHRLFVRNAKVSAQGNVVRQADVSTVNDSIGQFTR